MTGDVENAQDVARAYEGVDVVVSCLGRNVLAAQVELIRLAEESASVKWFFPSEYGTDIEYDASSKDEKPHQTKLKVREFIRNHVKRVQCTYLVTGPYIDMYLTLIPGVEVIGGYDVRSRKAVVVGSGNDAVGFTSMPECVNPFIFFTLSCVYILFPCLEYLSLFQRDLRRDNVSSPRQVSIADSTNTASVSC